MNKRPSHGRSSERPARRPDNNRPAHPDREAANSRPPRSPRPYTAPPTPEAAEEAEAPVVSGTPRIYGKHPVRSAFESERPIHKLWLSEGLQVQVMIEFRNLAKEHQVPVQIVPANRLGMMCPGAPTQGIVAEIGAHDYTPFEDLLDLLKEKGQEAFVIVLDQVQDPHNLGAIARTAEAAGAHGIIIPRHGSAGLTEGAAKASVGAIERIPISRVTNLSRALEQLQAINIWSMGFALEGEISYFDANLTGPVALVIGGEHAGIRPNVAKHCDMLMRIPTISPTHSLNASVAGSLAIYEVLRQRQVQARKLLNNN